MLFSRKLDETQSMSILKGFSKVAYCSVSLDFLTHARDQIRQSGWLIKSLFVIEFVKINVKT